MLNPASPLARLLDAPMRPGRVTWIGIRPTRRAPVVSVPSAEMELVHGVVGDRYRSATTGRRQVTLIGAIDLLAIAQALGREAVTPELLRRNVVVSGVNLHALHGRCFQLGSAILEATGDCHPCSRMEEIFGLGGYNAVRGHGGITARVIASGVVRLGDAISRVP